ncbi:MAG: hypothetical protein DWQ01_16475 [Planctomycetota bacterium]|nr:MAG: hypothetical protein DWQ01_16475 [Planctomycetota bacterium]
MIFPLNGFTEWNLELSLLVSLGIGFGFGFMLEKSGFGSSKILAGIFYLKDWRVLKVMFTAIVTAMIGLFGLQGLGWVALDQLAYRSTFLWPQIVGGLILGVGFVTAGYCPGTAVVGTVSGKLDGLFALFGVMTGILIFEEAFGVLAPFYQSGAMGEVSLFEWMGLPAAVVVGMVLLMAGGAFTLVRWLEAGGQKPLLPRRFLGGLTSMAAGALLVAVAHAAGPGEGAPVVSETPSDGRPLPEVSALEVAHWQVEGRVDFLLLDLRPDDSVPGLFSAVPASTADLLDLRLRPDFDPQSILVIVDQQGGSEAQRVVASLRQASLEAVLLQGGAETWQKELLDPERKDPFRSAYRAWLKGENPFGGAAPPPKPKTNLPPRKKPKKKGGCS